MLSRRILLFLLAACAASPQSHEAAGLGRQVVAAGLDPAECYRVRELEITLEDAHFYLADGYLMFGKPVNGAPIAAVFSGDTEGGDAEVLLMPPDRSERKTLATYTGAPNLNEHFDQAAFIFTDASARGLLEQLRATGRKAPEIAPVMTERWSPVISNLLTSFESRIVLDLLTPGARGGGFFEAVIQGRKLGNFDVLYDARGYEQLVAGQVSERRNGTWWDTWASFATRSHRNLAPPRPEQQIQSYQISATLDPTLTLHCVTKIRVRTTEDSRNVLAFDLSGLMRATSAKVDGKPAEVYARDSVREGLRQNTGNELLLVLPSAALDPGTEHEVEITHEGRVVLEAGHQVYFAAARGSWYPTRGVQFSTYDVTYRYPRAFDLVMAGKVLTDRVEGEERITRRVPDGRVRLLGFNLGQYERRSTDRGGITVEVCANRELEDALRPKSPEPPSLPDDGRAPRRRNPGIAQIETARIPAPSPLPSPTSQLTRIADEIASATAFYRARFGDPPVTHIEVSPLPGRFGQGFAGMIYLPTLNYVASLVPGSDTSFFGDFLMAHEVAHQWWGNVVTSGSYHHEWLMEALSSYSAALYMESRRGPKAVETALEGYRRTLFVKGPDGETAESEGPVVQGRRLESSNNPNAFFSVLYGKGTWIIHMLRRRMGDERFIKMLGELRRRYEWKPLDTESFRTLCAEFLPPNSPDSKLEAFFDQWVYGTGVPALKLTYSVKGRPGAYRLTGVVKQSEVPDDFTVAVPVEVQTGRGKPVVHLVRTSDGDVAFTVPVASASAKAVLDPGWSVLRR